MDFVKKAVEWGTRKSPWIIHFNAGACNGCDIEVVDALTPRFDLERVGVLKQGSPRHADILVCTGAVTLQVRERLRQIYEQMPDPKFVIAVGACACTGGIFDGCYCVSGGIDTGLPVDVYIPGCAVRPEAIISAVSNLLESLEEKEAQEKKLKKKKKGKITESNPGEPQRKTTELGPETGSFEANPYCGLQEEDKKVTDEGMETPSEKDSENSAKNGGQPNADGK